MVKQAGYDLGYTVTNEGEKRHIKFKGDGLSWAAYFVLPVSTLIILLVLLSVLPAFLWFIPICLFGVLAFVVYKVFQTQGFTFTPASIIKDGVDYDLARVSEVLIDNPMDKSVSYVGQPGFIIGGTGVAGASVAAIGTLANATTSALAGASVALAASSAKRRYRVRIRYGAKVVTLARNLKYDRAVSIFRLVTGQ
ncbi:conserved membrane hypothetical protein [Roseovarius sp. EC-HK134]|uniref:hypothetical protein n=1 Tax=unclassified Roseovarius TaxID=2614913 RepID=UPI0012577126|nr:MULTISPECIES: hypothetical protein [unclassified Roseovarius]VVT28954.1 conserved membrane hypothetical protein [Roseovarius sp. EC-HK134]VVT30057.1 conserved membrane hypothetical protein [Roseovarius sp. EC-SD190]